MVQPKTRTAKVAKKRGVRPVKAKAASQAQGSWDATVAPAIPIGKDAVVTLLLSVDGEDAYSAVYAHKTPTSPGVCLYETDEWLSDLWSTDGGPILAAGEEGVLHEGSYGSAKRWTTDQAPFDAMLTAVWADEAESIYVAAENAIGRRVGRTWHRVLEGAPSAFDVIRGTRNGSRVYAAGRRGVLAALDDAGWSLLDSGTNMDLNLGWGQARQVAMCSLAERMLPPEWAHTVRSVGWRACPLLRSRSKTTVTPLAPR